MLCLCVADCIQRSLPHGYVALRLQRFSEAQTVAQFPVLAELELACNTRDFDFDTDDCLEHRVDVVSRRIAHFPGLRQGSFVRARETRDHASHEPLVIADADFSM